MMRRWIFILVAAFIMSPQAWPCDACEKQQPAFTRGITHGAGPESSMDWVIVSVMIVVSLFTLVLSLKYLFRPGEKNRSHIKHSVLE